MGFLSSEATVTTAEHLSDDLTQLFERNDVDLVLSGAGRSYERSYPMRDMKAVATTPTIRAGSGVIYIRSGSGGGTEHGTWAADKPPAWSAKRDNTMSTVVTLYDTPVGLWVRTWGRVGSGRTRLVDSFIIR